MDIEKDMLDRNEQIHSKGFDMFDRPSSYKTIKVGKKTLDDAVLDLTGDAYRCYNNKYIRYNKPMILKALKENNVIELRKISNYFYRLNGLYTQLCNYFAFMYRYDWYVVPEVYDDTVKEDKILKEFSNILNFLDATYIKKICGDIALQVIKNGVYYGYIVPSSNSLVLQELPPEYCRVRYMVGVNPAVEFNMKYFDTISDVNYRMRVIKLFPEEFQKGYLLYKQGKLPPDVNCDIYGGWYLLDPKNTVRFSFGGNGDIYPFLVHVIPAILDLDDAQDLDRKKQMQQLLKIIVQKLPLDKNGDLIFDVEEARDIHVNAVEMLSRAIGVDVLTTFADVDSITVSDNYTSANNDELERVERQIYNSAGVSKNIFNTESNLSLTYSILQDESTLRNLLLQFNIFFDRVTQALSKNKKKYNFKFYMLETTQYNYKELSKQYKEMVQIGYSKMLPQIALGHSQSFILNSVKFENEVLHLSEVMIPPLMSSTMSGEDILGRSNKTDGNKTQIQTEENKTGRPEKPDTEKSDKTLKNKESLV